MSRAPSAVAAIGGFGVGVAVLSVTVTASIILIAPEPPSLRMTLRDAAIALQKDVPGFERVIGTPPDGRRALLLERVLSGALRRSLEDIRVVWIDDPSADVSRAKLVMPDRIASSSQDRPPVVFMRRSGAIEVVKPSAVDGLLQAVMFTQPQPGFIASERLPDGRWRTVRPETPLLSGWRLRVLAALVMSLLLLAPIAWLFARRMTRPFRTLARSLNDGWSNVPMDGPRELREAAAAITAMRTRLADQVAERTRMLTAVAHDLRTPLTSLRLRIEAVAEPHRSRMSAEVDRMQGMIAEVLDFTRTGDDARRRFDLRTLLADTISDIDAGREIVRLLPGGDVVVELSEQQLRRAVENLVINAVDYAGGGEVELSVSATHIQISVVDKGPGIPVADRERLLRPFERGEASRNRRTGGAGLGLSIVRDFAIRHRGDIQLLEAKGGGLHARLSLPLTARA